MSEATNGATYESLFDALTVTNDILEPEQKRGGMTIKYIQSLDNKYVQYRLMAQNFTTNTTQWQGVDDEPTVGSNNLVKSGGVARITDFIIRENAADSDEIIVQDSNDEDVVVIDSEGVLVKSIKVGNRQEYSEPLLAVLDQQVGNGISFEDDNSVSLLSIDENGVYIKSNNICSQSFLSNSEICDYYAINNNGDAVANNLYGCSSFIECRKRKSMTISMMQEPDNSGYGLAFYDSSKNFISFIPADTGEKGRVLKKINIPNRAYYFRTTYFNYEDTKLYGDFYCDLSYYKRKNIDQPIYFSVEVNQVPNRFWDDTDATEIATDYKKTTGVLWLPSTYTQTGKPVPLIIYFHGATHYVYYGTWGATTSFYNQKKYWVDRGYAVMDCNGMKDNNKIRILGFGCPQNIDAYHKCFEYVVRNYNVQDKAFLIGASHGNLTAINYAYSYPSEILKLAILSGATSIQHEAAKVPSEFESIASAYYGTDGTYENDKFNGFDPIKRVVSIDNNEFIFSSPCQIKALLGANEISESEYGTGGNIYKNLIKVIDSLRNSRQIADVRIIEGEGHNIVSGNVVSVDEEILRWFNK